MIDVSTNDSDNQITIGEEMLVHIMGQLHARALYVVTRLKIADALADGPRTADDLAAECNVHPASLYRVLRLLTMHDIFRQTDTGAFSLTPRSETLRQDAPGSLARFALMFNEVCYEAVENLEHSVRTGENAFEHVHDLPFFDYFQQNPAAGRLFGEAMTDYGTKVHGGLLNAYDLDDVSSICDIGGSHGILLGRILERYPHIDAALFDLPHVIDGANDVLKENGLADRIQTVAGNFFESIPAGYDVYILASIIHDWDDENALTILKNVRGAMRDDSRVLILDTVIRTDNAHIDFAKMMDAVMLILLDGRERTEDEFRMLLAKADLELTRVIPTSSPGFVVEAVPAS